VRRRRRLKAPQACDKLVLAVLAYQIAEHRWQRILIIIIITILFFLSEIATLGSEKEDTRRVINSAAA
jgi:hypothetical protein